MKTAVVTDTNSGISADEARELGAWSIEMPVLIDGEVRYEGKDLSYEGFFQLLADGHLATTSQPSPGDVCDLWDTILSSGYDELVYLPMSAGLSYSFDTARIASAEFGGRVRVVDDRRISVTLRSDVMEALRLAEAGVSAAHIQSKLQERAGLSSIYLAVDDLGYLKRGGRVSPAAASIGSILKVKPILTVTDGRFEPLYKEKGMTKAIAKLFRAAHHDVKKKFGDREEGVAIGVTGSGLSHNQEAELLDNAKKEFPKAEVFFDRLPLSISVHTGPGAIGIGLHQKISEEEMAL